MASVGVKTMRASGHIPAIIILQVVFVTLSFLFLRYNPNTAQRSDHSVSDGNRKIKDIYPMYADVHVMIFLGIGLLMTFLKKYGLSAVSLNLLCGALSVEVFTLARGLSHPQCVDPKVAYASPECPSSWPYIDIDVTTMIAADFATAVVLISFGVVVGVTSPLQLVIMTVFEMIIFVVNDTIVREYIGAIDLGCTITIHLFGALFGLAVARVLYNPEHSASGKETSSTSSDLTSMIGTIFLWAFWPSFNGVGAATGDAQERAVVNTYFSLCAAVMSTFAFSALITPSRKFSMEHIQNATLAGGVAVGASVDMMLTPGGAVAAGSVGALLTVLGLQYVQPFLLTHLKIHDTCGVNNLHGIPGLFGGLLSVLIAGIASPAAYDQFSDDLAVEDKSLVEIFPALAVGGTPASQALSQFLAILITIGISIVGGLVTGLVMLALGKLERMAGTDFYNDDWNINDMESKEDMFVGQNDESCNGQLSVDQVSVKETSALLSSE